MDIEQHYIDLYKVMHQDKKNYQGVSLHKETSNIANTGNAGDYKGAAMHRDALAIAMMEDVKIETQRDASLRADEIVATSVYGVGEIHDSYGVELHFDSSIQ